MYRKRKVKISKRIFLIGGEKLSEEMRKKVAKTGIPVSRGFTGLKIKLENFIQQSHEEAIKLLNNVIFSLKAHADGELIRWGNTLKHWRKPILNHFDNRTTNGFTEGFHTEIKMLKGISYGLRNMEVY